MIYEKIKEYNPYNELEEADKALILDFINKNPDYLLRTNLVAHLTTSCIVLNQKHDRILMCYHNIFDSWSWLGGHNDGEEDCLLVALKEAKEETGINDFFVLSKDIFSLECLTVDGHYKRGKYVPSHLHLNVTYLLEADDKKPLKVKADENKGLRWMNFEEFIELPNEKWMVDNVYQKLLKKIKETIL